MGINIFEIGGTGYETLDDALEAVGQGTPTTIKLLDNYDYHGQCRIAGKQITFDLGGYTLNIFGTEIVGMSYYGLVVCDGGELRLADPKSGAFNVCSPMYAMEVYNGSKAEVTSVTVTAATAGSAVYAAESVVTIHGSVSATGMSAIGVNANDKAIVTVNGDVQASGDSYNGVNASLGSTVNVNGNVEINGFKASGVVAQSGSFVNISNGHITVEGDSCFGVYTVNDSAVTVKNGDITVTAADAYGVFASNGGQATIDGAIVVSPEAGGTYISVSAGGQRGPKTPEQNDAVSSKAGYIQYSCLEPSIWPNAAIVWVKDPSGASGASGGSGASDGTGTSGDSGTAGGSGTSGGSGTAGGPGTSGGSGTSGDSGAASGSGTSGGTAGASDDKLTVNGVELEYTVVGGVAVLNIPDQATMAAILKGPSPIIFDLSGYSNIDFTAAAAWFKDVDKDLTFITANGSVTVKTKTLWNNSGKNRIVQIRGGKASVGNI